MRERERMSGIHVTTYFTFPTSKIYIIRLILQVTSISLALF